MSYLSEVLADSPLMYWSFNSGGTDVSGNARHADSGTNGSSVAGLLPTTGDLAVQFNGSSQYLIKNYGSWMNTSSITLEVWVKTTATSCQLVSRDNVGRAFQLAISATGKLDFIRIFNSAGSTSVVTASSVTSINDGVTHHVVATYDGTTCLIYVDGALNSTTSMTGGLYASGSSAVNVARYHTGTLWYAGVLDELAWYGTVLSAGRISAHHLAGTATIVAGERFTSSATMLDGTPLVGISVSGDAFAPSATMLDGSPATGPVLVSGDVFTVATTMLDGSAQTQVLVAGDAFGSAATMLDGLVAGAPYPGEAFSVSVVMLDGGSVVTSETDTSNFYNGRRRGGLATVELDVPVATPPVASTVARVDKAIALPQPVLVKGRPT